jgi:hypothetical protein
MLEDRNAAEGKQESVWRALSLPHNVGTEHATLAQKAVTMAGSESKKHDSAPPAAPAAKMHAGPSDKDKNLPRWERPQSISDELLRHRFK